MKTGLGSSRCSGSSLLAREPKRPLLIADSSLRTREKWLRSRDHENLFWMHPCVCEGEPTGGPSGPQPKSGSSPRAREGVDTLRRRGFNQGSSLRVREKLFFPRSKVLVVGIIPACEGKALPPDFSEKKSVDFQRSSRNPSRRGLASMEEISKAAYLASNPGTCKSNLQESSSPRSVARCEAIARWDLLRFLATQMHFGPLPSQASA